MAEADHNDRYLACAMHVAAIPFPFVAPIVGIVAAKPDSFLRRHSTTRLMRETLTLALFWLAAIIYFVATIPDWIHNFQTGFRDFDWIAFLMRTVAVWVMTGLYSLWNTIEGAWMAYRAVSGLEPTRRMERQSRALVGR